ncbi:hypothetical protein QQP08_010388 [Theobroma cacao]|nr:hypothetical protein QQP08_010388 [Theobroma cacao]
MQIHQDHRSRKDIKDFEGFHNQMDSMKVAGAKSPLEKLRVSTIATNAAGSLRSQDLKEDFKCTKPSRFVS